MLIRQSRGEPTMAADFTMMLSSAYASEARFLSSCFTGKERDAESGNDYFGARYFGSSMGRFLSPDPFIPFNLKKDQFQAWISNPQHWNKYAYALNNPLKCTNPTGMTETVFLEFSKDLT
jgi:RHS repeat-associated protein